MEFDLYELDVQEPEKYTKEFVLVPTNTDYKTLTRFLNPKYAPMNVRGTDTPNHRANNAINVLNGTAPELPSLHRIRFIKKNRQKTVLKFQN